MPHDNSVAAVDDADKPNQQEESKDAPDQMAQGHA
jgi:hypothetical protein